MFGLVKLAVALICATAIAGPAAVDGAAGGHLSAGERVPTIGGLAWPGGREYTAVAGDGRVYVAAAQRRGGAPAGVQVRRYLPDGGLDPGFGVGGVVVAAEPAGAPFRLGGLLVDADGLPYLVGTTGPAETTVARLTKDGALDTSYGDGGVASLDLGRAAAAGPLATIDQQRRVLVAAGRVGRLTPSGHLDPGFGEGGSVAIPGGVADGLGVDVRGRAQLVLPDAADGRAFRLMGLDPAGRPDRSLGPDGVRAFRSVGAARGFAVTPYGTALVLGTDASRGPDGVAKAEVLRIASEGDRESHERVGVALPRGGTAEGIFDDPNGFGYLTGTRPAPPSRTKPGSRRKQSFVTVLGEGQAYEGFPYDGIQIVPSPHGLVLRGLSITDGDRKILLHGIMRGRHGTAHGFFVEYPAARYVVTYAPEPAG